LPQQGGASQILSGLFEKLGVHSQTDLVRYALRRGIIKLDE
jgi:DNA-binding CsgD family transcriptional regulator